jgi:hypothetical protein
MRFHPALLALTICTWAVSAFAQTAQLSGIITDPAGKNVPGADIQVRNEGTGLIRTTMSTAEGDYTIPALPPGSYVVRVQKTGFKTLTREGLELQVEQRARLDLTIELGAVESQVSVTADAPMMNTADASVSTVVNRQFVENIPLNGRSFQSLIALSPGVVITPTSAGSENGQFSVAGQRPGSNYFTVDGVSANFAAANGIFDSQTANGGIPAFSTVGSTASLVSIDALQEFRLETSTYAPEFGRENGAQVVLVTRSGANQLHGSAFDYLRNDVLDANDWFANSTGLAKLRERQNDFGGVLGGPIIKDKTFFFFSYEGLRVVQPHLNIDDVPSVAARQSAPANIRPIVDAFPLPNGPSTGDGLSQLAADAPNRSTLDAASLRIDHAIDSKLTLFGRFNHAPSSTIQATCGGGPPSFVCTQTEKMDTATLGLTAILTPTITNDFRFNYSQARAGEVFSLDNSGGAIVPPGSALAAPWQDLATGWTVYDVAAGRFVIWVNGLGANNQNHQVNITDSVAVVKGTHSMKFGVDLRRLTAVEGHPTTGTYYQWLTVPELVGGAPPDVMEVYQDPHDLHLRFYNFSGFAQDTWKASHRLTLTYGVRWDHNPPPVVTSGNPPYVLSEVTNLATATLLPRGTPLWHANWKNFAPRFGASYLLRPDARPTVLRVGFGQFYDLGTSASGSLDDGQGFFPYSLVTHLCSFGSGPACNSAVPYSGPQPPFAFTQPYAGVMRAFDPHLKLPSSLQWSIALEQSLSANQTFKVTYVGSAGRNLQRDNVISNPNAILSGLFLATNAGYSNYHALQLQFQRRLSHGLQALLSYTWSHSLDLNSADVASPWGGSSVGIPSNLYNINQEYGNSDFDIRHTFSTALTYNIPTARLQNSFARILLRNWAVDSNTSARTGTAFNVTYQPDTPGAFAGPTGAFYLRPDQISGQPVYVSDANAPGGKRLNVMAFTIPSVLGQGSEGRNTLRGFPLLQIDLAARRQFNITERIHLQFRADGFNIINHSNFGNPLNNMGTCGLGGQCAPVYGWGTSQALLNQGMGAGAVGSNYANPFGSLYQIGGPRSFQLSMKLQF